MTAHLRKPSPAHFRRPRPAHARRLFALVPAAALLLLLSTLLPAAASAQSPRRKAGRAAPPRRAAGKVVSVVTPHTGRIENSVYTNDFFNLRLTIPEGWRVADAAGVAEIDQKGVEAMSAGSPARKEQIARAAEKVVNLITVGKIVPSERGNAPAMLIVVAEPIPSWLVTSGREYNAMVKQMMTGSGVNYELEDAGTETVGGVEFAVMRATSEQPAGTVRQKFYSAVRKGHGLALIWTYMNEQGEQAIAEVVKTIKFE